MFVGEAPGPQEDNEGIPFVGPSGKLLRSVFPTNAAYFTNAIKCFSKPLIKHARACWAYLQEEIEAVQPRQIVAVGEWASKILTEHNVPHTKIEHPSNVLQGRKSVEDWRRSIESKEALPEIVPEEERVLEIADDSTPIAVDIETCSNDSRRLMDRQNKGLPVPWFPPSSLYCVGFSVGRQRRAYPVDAYLPQIHTLLRLPNPKVFHNALYDALWLQHEGFEVNGDIHDTMWLLALRDEGGSRGLEVGPYVYPWHIPDKCDDAERVLSYCANDAYQTWTLFHREDLHAFTSHDLYRLYQRMARPLVSMCLEGVPILRHEWGKAIEVCSREGQRYGSILTEIAGIDWDSDDKVAQFFTEQGVLSGKKTASGKRLSVDEEALKRVTHPAAAILLQKRKVDTLLQTFLLPPAGMDRAHGVLTLNRAATGRTAMSRMNLQNIPKDDAELADKQVLNLRKLFGHDDYDWVKMDLIGAELVIIAVEANCRLLLQWFREGRDVHKMMAGRILGKPPEEVTDSEKRRLGKVPNFALCYGGDVYTLRQKAWEEYGIVIPDEEAEWIVEEWFRALPEIALWHSRVGLQIRLNRSVSSPLGRVRTVPFLDKHSYNVALNAPIQGTVSDLLLMGLDASAPWPGTLVNLVHDETDILIPRGSWPERRTNFLKMARTIAEIHPRFPMGVEIAVGRSWGGPWDEEIKVRSGQRSTRGGEDGSPAPTMRAAPRSPEMGMLSTASVAERS